MFNGFYLLRFCVCFLDIKIELLRVFGFHGAWSDVTRAHEL